MNIGIMVHSDTGNTLSVAEKLKEKLGTSGHDVTLEQVAPVDGTKPGTSNPVLKSNPSTDGYDALILAAPVQAFSLSAVMKTYLAGLVHLDGKKVAGFVTKALPFGWTGGNHALRQMKKACERKGASVCGTGYVVWKDNQRKKMTSQLLEDFSRLF